MRTIQMLAVLALAVMSARANQFIQFSEIAFTSSMGEAGGFGGMSWDGKNSGGENVNFGPFIVDGMIISPGLAGYVVFPDSGQMFDETNQFVLNFGGGGYSIIRGMTTEFDSGTIQVRVTPEPVGVGFLGILGMLVYAKQKLLVSCPRNK